MKKHLLKLLTGLTAVSMAVAQPVSVMACENGGTLTESEDSNSDSASSNQGTDTSSDQGTDTPNDQETGTSSEQLSGVDNSDAGDVGSNNGGSSVDVESSGGGNASATAYSSAGGSASGTKSGDGFADTTGAEEVIEGTATGEDAGIDPNQQTDVTGTELSEEIDGTDGTELNGESNGENGAISGVAEAGESACSAQPGQTEAADKIADQSLESTEKAVVDGEVTAEKVVNTSTADTDSIQNNENNTVDLTKSAASEAEEKKSATDAAETKAETEETSAKETEETASEAEKNKKTGTNGLYLSDALAENNNIAVLSLDQDLDESFLGANLARSIAENERLVKVTLADGTSTFYDSLQTAINNAGNSSTIELQDDVTEDVTIEDAADLVINLCGKKITSAKTAIESAAANAVEKVKSCINIINSKNVTINSTTKESGKEEVTGTKGTITGADGTAIKISQSSVDLIGLLITNNSGSYGGGMNVNDSVLTVKDCSIEGNTSVAEDGYGVNGTGVGGGILAVNSMLNIENTNFAGNTSTNNWYEFVNDKNIWMNASENGGGAISANNCRTTIKNSYFVGNHATDAQKVKNPSADGGAIAASYGTLTIKNSTFTNNTAADCGGAVNARGVSDINISDSTFGGANSDGETFGNSCGNQGGAIFIDKYYNYYEYDWTKAKIYSAYQVENVSLNEVNILNNVSRVSGGGIYLGDVKKANIKNSIISGNTTEVNFGGGVCVYGTVNNPKVTISNSKINENNARLGGGLAVGYANVEVRNSAIEENKSIIYTDAKGTSYSASGAGILTYTNGKISLKKTSVTGNGGENTSKGGGFMMLGAGGIVTTDSETKVMNNTAVTGGGLYVCGNSTAQISTGTKLYNNTAATAGDDVYLAPGSSIKLTPVGSAWTLDSCKHIIDGWYIDAKGNRWSETSATGLKGNLPEGVTVTLNADGSYNISVAADAKSGFALKAAHEGYTASSDPFDPSATPTVTVTTTTTATATPAVLGAARIPELVETAAEEPEVFDVEREPAVLGAIRGHGTGDESRTGVWGVVSLASLAALAGIGAFLTGKKKED